MKNRTPWGHLKRQILEMLPIHQPLSARQIGEKIGRPRKEISSTLGWLATQGILSQCQLASPKGHGVVVGYYVLANQPEYSEAFK